MLVTITMYVCEQYQSISYTFMKYIIILGTINRSTVASMPVTITIVLLPTTYYFRNANELNIIHFLVLISLNSI